MKNKLVLFDLDGTLIDTLEDLNAAVNFALKKNGFSERSVEHTYNAIGNGVFILMQRSLPEGVDSETHLKCLNDFKDYYLHHYLVHTKDYPGMRDTLIELKNRGYTLGVVTNKYNELSQIMINHFFPNIFAIIQGEEPKFNKKPSPDMVNYAMKKLGFDTKNTIYVGDSYVDIETAKTAHISLILANYGYHKGNEFYKIKDAPHIDAPIDLLKILI